LAALVVLIPFSGTITPAHAAGVELVLTIADEDGEGAADVDITVADSSGELLEATTDGDGKATVQLGASGPYAVYFDADTLPDGIGPDDNPTKRATTGTISPQYTQIKLTKDGTRDTVEPAPLEATDNETASASSSSSEGTSGGDADDAGDAPADPAAQADQGGTGFFGRLAPKVATGLTFGLLLALASIGISLVYGTTRLNNFSHGELVTFGSFIAYMFASQLATNGWVAILGALVLGGAFGWVQDAGLWRPLRKKRVGVMQIMIVSIGLALTLRYVFAFIWGPNRLTIPADNNPLLSIGTVNLRYWDLMGSLIAVILILIVAYFLNRTNLGKATRAVADNRALAAASGIDVEKIIRIVWVGAGALAGVSGALIGYYQTLQWNGGALILLMLFASVTLGGLGTTWGALVGAIIIGLAMDVSTMWIPTSLKYVVAMLIMIVVLLVRPQGLLGSKQRIG
jgi:branched-chain amino acid transport system permease protein